MNFNQIDDFVEAGAYTGCSPGFARTVGRQISIKPNKNKSTSFMTAQMEALAAGDASDHALFHKRADELWPQMPYQRYPTYRYETVMAEGYMSPMDRLMLPELEHDSVVPIDLMSDAEPLARRKPAAIADEDMERQIDELIGSVVNKTVVLNKPSFEDQVANMIQEISELKEQVFQLQNTVEIDETPDEVNVRIYRTKMIVSEVISFDKKFKNKLKLEDIDKIQCQVEAKIQSDRHSADYDVYQRNQGLLQHLMRRKKYSKSAYKILKQFRMLLSVSGDLMRFTGQLFDREYLNPKSDKYYKYVSILTFMLKYQRLSKRHAKLWFKDVKEHDNDKYFFDNWQLEVITTGVPALADENALNISF